MIDTARVFRSMKISRQTDGTIQALWSVPVDLPYFSGHFPGSPIFPAVGIVDATLHTLRTHLKNPSLHLAGVPVAKFISPITPELDVIVELRAIDKTDWQAEWKEQDSSKLLASVRLRCRI